MKEVDVNGTIYEFPDSMDDAAIKDVLRKKFPIEQQAEHKSPLLGGAGSFASGFNRMVTSGLPGLPVDTGLNVVDLLKAGAGSLYGSVTGKPVPEALELTNRANVPMSSAWLERQISRIPGGADVISSDAAEYPGLHAAGMAAGSTVGSKSPMRTGSIAATAGIAGQKTAEATGSTEAGILANLLTAPVAARASDIRQLTPNSLRAFINPASRQASIALKPYSEAQIREAVDRQRQAQLLQSPLAASQALGGGGRVADLENYVMDSPYAPAHLLQNAQTQPQRTAALAKNIVTNKVGTPDFSLGRANRIEAAAEAGLAMPKEVARQLAQPFYDELARTRPQLPEAARWKLAGELEALNRQVGLIEESFAGRAVSDVAKTATTDSMILKPGKGNQPFRRAEGGIYELDNYLKEISSRIESLGTLGADAKQSVERAGLRPALSSIKKTLIENSDTLAKAKDTYHQTRSALEDTVRNTGIADIAKRPDADAIKKPAANWNTLSLLLKRKQSPADLKRADAILARQDPDAVAQIVRNTLDEVYKKSFDENNPKPGDAVTFARHVREIPNLDTAIEIAARRAGEKNPAGVAKGFEVALKVIESSGLPRGMPGGSNVAARASSSSPERSASTLMFGHGLAQRATLLRNIQMALNKQEILQLTKAIDRPDSVAALKELAGLEPTSARAIQLVKNMLRPTDDITNLTLRGLLPIASEPEQRGLLPVE